MLQKFLAVTAVFGLIFIRGGHCQCYTAPGCGGDRIDVTEAGLPIADQADCCVGTNAGLSYNDGSSCNLCIVHGFAQAAYDVDEDQRLDTRFQLNVKGTTRFAGALVVAGVITATADGTAADSDFERLTPIPVTNNAEIRLFAANDEITLEYDDRVLLRFAPDNPALITGLPAMGEYVRDSATVNIIDNDLLEINFLESDYSIVEGSAELSSSIMIQLRQNQNPFTLMLSPVSIDTAESKNLSFFINSETILPGSRATADDDFSDNVITITVPANSNPSYRIDQFFNISDDDIDEDEQSFAIVAEIGQDVPDGISCFQTEVGATECFGRRGATEIRITDNDPMIIGFTQRIRTVSEGQVPGVDLFQLEINVSSVRTAEREHPMVFRLQEASTTATVETLIASSPFYDATFGLRANPDDPIQEARDLAPGSRTIQPLLLTAIRNDLIPEDLECYTIRIFPVDVAGRRELFGCYEDDDMADKYFCEHTICIIDDDEPFEVAFVRTMHTVDESAGPVLVCVNLTRPEFDILDETVNVFVTDFPPSMYIPVGDVPRATPDIPDFLSRYPMAERSDFQQQTSAVNSIDDVLISQLMRIVCYNQTIYDDLRLEANEYAGLMLEVRDNPQTTVLTLEKELFNETSILIVDNDRAVVGLEMTFFSVSEGVGYVELCAYVSFPEITCPIEFPFEVGLSTADGTAVETMDYGAIDVILMFDTCETRKCVNVTITDDLVDEPLEFFTYTLTRTPSLDPRIELNPTNGRVEIIDNDVNINVGYDPISYVASEGQGSVELTIVIFDPPVGGAPRPFTLVINTQDGTASALDNDYNAVSGEIVQFNVGDTFQTHRIIINHDMMCENDPNEFFFSNIALDSGVQPIFVIQPQATVTINDDAEPECRLPIEVGYEFSVYTTTEGIGVETLCAVVMNFPGGSPRPFTINATTEDGSAVSGDDYVGVVDVPLMFQVGDDRVCHDVVIIDDDDCETPFEDFFSNLEYGSGDMPIIITRDRTRVIINDTAEPECEPITVGYNPATYMTTETSGSVTLTVRVFSHPGGAPRPFTLVVNTQDGTATVADDDYVPVDGEIIQFNAGDVTQTHTITINDDDECENDPNENFFSNIALDSGIPDITVTVPRATVTIDDTSEPECGQTSVFVNDTLTGDPLLTVSDLDQPHRGAW
ncbi:hypothetical protein GBAR_LOCUS8570 [Geodia barretti]|uniref:Calx-beta domain-containing protein n=2 Tax=Geodia barretti TaxID=519541 RepID=A0AA35RL60_GEOBA|nr:hypothetical protein GBAR_LOCUS8570 [Geodia barretti]